MVVCYRDHEYTVVLTLFLEDNARGSSSGLLYVCDVADVQTSFRVEESTKVRGRHPGAAQKCDEVEKVWW